MEKSYEARGENLGRRKKPKSSNYSGKFLSLPFEIVALRFRPGGTNGTSTHPSPLPMALFLKMVVIYAIVSRDVLLKHLRCRSFLDLR